MRLNPLIERKMSGYRKKRYLREKSNNFPQIKEEDYEGEEKEWATSVSKSRSNW